MRRSYVKILLAIPFLILGLSIYFFFKPVKLESFDSSFISISLTIATFSISFSFLQYNFSPYKSLLKSISGRQLIFTYATLLLALIPLGALVIDKNSVPELSLFVIPLLAYNILLLWSVADEECDPKILLSRATKEKHLTKFLKRFKRNVELQLETQEKFNFSKNDETPSHDWADKYSTAVAGDPFHLANMVAEYSLKSSDTFMYEEVLKSYCLIIDALLAHPMAKEIDFRFKLEKLIEQSFENLLKQTTKLSDSRIHRRILILEISNYLRGKALEHLQSRHPFSEINSLLTNFVEEYILTDSEAVLLVLSLQRQLCQKGIYDPPVDEDHKMFRFHLILFPVLIKQVGQAAIKKRSTYMMYRCLEELGYLGCTAVKNNHFQIITETLQAIVQLGRESRASGLDCFDQRCALDPPAHAKERLWWMLSWLHHLPEKDIEMLLRSFETAYSRLNGFKTQITITKADGQAQVNIDETKEPHKEGYSTEEYYKQVDYSDVNQIKEYKLY